MKSTIETSEVEPRGMRIFFFILLALEAMLLVVAGLSSLLQPIAILLAAVIGVGLLVLGLLKAPTTLVDDKPLCGES